MLPAIGLGAIGLLGQGINSFLQGTNNRADRKWQEKMYDRQRADSLTDWEMQNNYNSPAAQMERLKAGNLNPNLVYGQGATATGGAVRSSSPGSYKPQAPQIDLTGLIMSMYELNKTQAETDNLEKQKELLQAEVLNKKTLGRTMEFDLGLKESLRDTSLQFGEQRLKKLQADTEFTINSDERATALAAGTLRKAVEEILNMRLQRAKTGVEKDYIQQQIENMKTSRDLMLEDLKLKRMGIQPHDKMWQRALKEWLEENHPVKKIIQKGREAKEWLPKTWGKVFNWRKPW